MHANIPESQQTCQRTKGQPNTPTNNQPIIHTWWDCVATSANVLIFHHSVRFSNWFPIILRVTMYLYLFFDGWLCVCQQYCEAAARGFQQKKTNGCRHAQIRVRDPVPQSQPQQQAPAYTHKSLTNKRQKTTTTTTIHTQNLLHWSHLSLGEEGPILQHAGSRIPSHLANTLRTSEDTQTLHILTFGASSFCKLGSSK